jgi:gas vesicle protein
MNERSVVVLGAIVGAALGGMAGYLFLTERGRQLRADLEPRLDDLLRDLGSLQNTVSRARDAAAEGFRVIGDVTGEQRRWSERGQAAAH